MGFEDYLSCWPKTKTHLPYLWHIPTMVGFCHGGNLPESHDDDDDHNDGDDDDDYNDDFDDGD